MIYKQRMNKIILTDMEPGINPNSDELANVVVTRLGLMPRKKGSTEKMNKVLVELYERAKKAYREKNPTFAVMTVEEMALLAGITRQTMYDYLKRWLAIEFIAKTSFIGQENKVVVGYKLNGSTLENAFEKAKARINSNLDFSLKYILELQKTVKNEKISIGMKNQQENIEKEIS